MRLTELIANALTHYFCKDNLKTFVVVPMDWEQLSMSNEKGPDEPFPVETNKNKKKSKPGMTGYLEKLIPSKAIIDIVLKEDFDGDGLEEALVAYTELIPFPPETSVVWLKSEGAELRHIVLLPEPGRMDAHSGIFDNAVAADTDNDGLPELVLSLSADNGHYISVSVYDWKNGGPVSAWKSEEPCYLGSMDVADIDNDGVFEIIIDSGIMEGKEILALEEAGYHMRKSCFYKWDGNSYAESVHEVRMPYLSYNSAVLFLEYLWRQDYKKAYEMVLMPAFMGLDGLDDCSLGGFKKYAGKHIRPVLRRNLSKGRLVPSEPYDNFCLFGGFYDDISVELVNRRGKIFIQSLGIHKKF
ncbi:MAG: VCBS repeat-containing protein [Ruminiclostridium sp.]|nr:VCBS repeat-containing protein [Ruminiclostridium sp.]